MASLSGSLTVNASASGPASGATTEAGAPSTGARSTLATCSVALAEPWSAFAAVNVTVNVPESW